MSDLRKYLLEEEVQEFRQLNVAQMKRDADNLEKAKWTVIVVVIVLALTTAYSVRYL